ncbi:hypothetical protein K474DRAFT_1661597 [Panus rudis PR-1116 ss-1]|nr:hypothetical protein K474DRAFT_1661597 [Panus rudis PR-1116 ss-1]
MSTATNSNNVNTHPAAHNSAGGSVGASLGQKVKGVFTGAQGVGDSIRGNAMDFVDSATGTGGAHPETQVGARKAEQGVAQMESKPTTTSHTGIGSSTGTAGSTI